MKFRDKVLNGRGLTIADAVNDNMFSSIAMADCFSIGNIRNLPACIDCRFSNGDRYALPYPLITTISFDKSRGIEIFVGSKVVYIKGFNLTLLYDYLVAFRVKYIQYSESTPIKGKPYISEITDNYE